MEGLMGVAGEGLKPALELIGSQHLPVEVLLLVCR